MQNKNRWLELTQDKYYLDSSGVAEDILSNDSDDSDDGNATDYMDLNRTTFMGERKLEHGEDKLYGRDGGEEEEEGDIKCTIGKRRAKVYRARVNVNGF